MSSVLENENFLEHWLNTPIGYFKSRPNYGNNINILLGLNNNEVKPYFAFILDKIEQDLGESIVNNINGLSHISVGSDSYIVINYKGKLLKARINNE